MSYDSLASTTTVPERPPTAHLARATDPVLLSLWRTGAYRAASFDPATGRGALVEHDGRQTMRLVAVDPGGFEETVATRRAVRGGPSYRTSTLRGRRDGGLEWLWRVRRPGLRRTETLTVDAAGHVAFRQVDRRPDRTTTFESTGPGRYRGVTTAPDGRTQYTSDWRADGRGGKNGSFTGPTGDPAGGMNVPGREDRDRGEGVTWTGPTSAGSVTAAAGAAASGGTGGSVRTVVETADGVTTYTTNEGDGHSVQTGSGGGRSWIKITVPGKADGDSTWVEMGTQSGAGASAGTTSDYTINGTTHADGSSSFERTDRNPTTGDREHTFGGRDAAGNGSYTSSVAHADGTVTITTRTTDKNGNGSEHVTTVDAQGNAISDGTSVVKGGITQRPGSGTGGSGSTGGTQPSTPPPVDSDDDADDDADDDSGDDAGDDSGDADDDSDGGDEPDSPDDGGDDAGRDNDGTDDGRPGIPWGKIGQGSGDDLDDLFGLLGGLGSGGGGDDGDDREPAGPDLTERMRRALGREIRGVGTGSPGGGGGADETGWGDGGEGFRGVPLVSGSFAPPPPTADETGWGDLNDPRALVALVESFAAASAGLAGSRTLAPALRR